MPPAGRADEELCVGGPPPWTKPADDGKSFDPAKVDLVSLTPAGDRVRLYIESDFHAESNVQLQPQEKIQ
jgi:hypothetical protein